ncbi:MAG TPA: patatin-like phospholipase family protein [Bryobacteraceae bacterium]|nr:patatin-like phospholipase family protein [Bryobacteraceae bacterium]
MLIEANGRPFRWDTEEGALRDGGLAARLRTVLRKWSSARTPVSAILPAPLNPPKIGLALGGGFARGVAHVGVLNVLRRENIPVHCVAGVSAGAIVAAAYASGTALDVIGKIGCGMRFNHVARWSFCRLGLAGSERMTEFLKRLLKKLRFEEMETPLGVVATDLRTGESVPFLDHGDVILPIRASCSYPGLFQPIRHEERMLVDGAMSMEVPALVARKMGATHVISVGLPMQGPAVVPENMLQVVNRCFQILQSRAEETWRRHSDVVITPDVQSVRWDGFESGQEMITAGEMAAEAALPQIRKWLAPASEPVQELAS